MEEIINKLDLKKYVGTVTLTDGSKVNVPKLSINKLIQIVKFLGTDGARLYAEIRELVLDETVGGIEKLTLVMGEIKEWQLVRIFSIILEIDDEEALALDINEMLDVLLVYAEETNLKKTFFQIRNLYKALYGKEMPTFKELMDNIFPQDQVEQQIQKEQKSGMVQEAEEVTKASPGQNS